MTAPALSAAAGSLRTARRGLHAARRAVGLELDRCEREIVMARRVHRLLDAARRAVELEMARRENDDDG